MPNIFGWSMTTRATKRLKTSSNIHTEYIISHGQRRVKPYIYEFSTHAKQRWYGRALLEVYEKEFAAHSAEYYVR